MKILILANSDFGLFQLRKELIEILIQNGHKVIISVPYGKCVSYFIQLGCQYEKTRIDRRGTNLLKDLSLVTLYWNIFRRIKPDVVLTYTIKPAIYGGIIASFFHVPYIVNITGIGSSIINGGWKEKLVMLLYKFSLPDASCVFFQNKMNHELFLSKKIRISHYELIPGSGINIDKFSKYDYPSGQNIEFAFIGRVMKDKGIEEYLQAARAIKKKYKNTVFHVCGFCEDNYKNELLAMHKQGTIVHHGMVERICEIYKRIHCLVLPSYSEGMSNTILEASACGRPVIVTNIPGCREAVEPSVTGFLVEKADAEDLINKIEKFIRLDWDIKRQMGLEARKKVIKEFDRKIVIDKYLKEIARAGEQGR